MLYDSYSTLKYRHLNSISKLYYSVGQTVFPVNFLKVGGDKASITFRRKPKDKADRLNMLIGLAGNAQYNLASMYAEGVGTKKDFDLAFEWYQKAANQNNPDGLYGLGWCYAHGKGVEKDKETALDLFRISAKKGHVTAKKIILDYESKQSMNGKLV